MVTIVELVKFKENIQALLKIKELLIPQVDGNFVKNWEEEANKYQSTSESILFDLKNTNYIEGFVNAIYSQLMFLRNNLSNYSNMEDIQKDKFKRLYVLAALGFIAKLKLIFFFTTYLNYRDDKNIGSFLQALENNMKSQLSEFPDGLDNQMLNNLLYPKDTNLNHSCKKDGTEQKSSSNFLLEEGSVYSNLMNEAPQNYNTDFYNINDQFNENVLNRMINNLVNIESQNNVKNENPYDNFNVNFPIFFNNINHVNNVSNMSCLFSRKNNTNHNANGNYEENLENANNPLPIQNDHISRDDSFTNSFISSSKESGNISNEHKNKTAYITKNAPTMNPVELYTNEPIVNYMEPHTMNNNSYIKNECNQNYMDKYLTDGYANFEGPQNIGRYNSNQMNNVSNYLQYQIQNNNLPFKNTHLNYNKGNNENCDLYGNKYY